MDSLSLEKRRWWHRENPSVAALRTHQKSIKLLGGGGIQLSKFRQYIYRARLKRHQQASVYQVKI